MTVKQRTKNNITEKNPDTNHDDVARKASEGGETLVTGSGSLVKILAALCYVTLVVAAGFAAFYLQRVLEEMGQISRRTEGSIQAQAELARRMESILQQVDTLRRVVDGFEPTVTSMRADLDGMGRALQRGEAEVQRMEEALQGLQKELLRDLSRSMQEVKEAQEQDTAAQERVVEGRFGELAHSIDDSVTKLTRTQDDTRVQIAELRASLESIENPAPLKEELLALASAVAELQTANQEVERTSESLGEQVDALGTEIHTRNQEVVSVVQEAESVRALVLDTAGAIQQSVSAVESSVQALSDNALSLEAGLDQATGSIQSVEEELRGTETQVERFGEEVGVRLRTVEENVDALQASEAERNAGLASLLSRSDAQESALATLGRELQNARSAGEAEVTGLLGKLGEAEQAHHALGGQVEALQSDLGELQNMAAILNSTQAEQISRDSRLTEDLEGLGQRLAVLGEAVSEAQASNLLKAAMLQEGLQQLRTTLDGLVSFSNKVKIHADAIGSLKSALEETNASMSALSKKPKVLDKNV